MTSRLNGRMAQLEAAHASQQGVHVFQVPRDLEGEALSRWKAETAAGLPEAAAVVWVELRNAEMT